MRTILVVFLLMTCGACNRSNDPPTDNVTTKTNMTGTESNAFKLEVRPPGIHQETIQNPDGSVMRFTILVPNQYSAETASPLIVALHYGGPVTPFYGRGLIEGLIQPVLHELNAIIVAPDSVGGDWTTPENEASVLKLYESVKASYNIDSDKTLLTGFSLGGHGTWFIAGKHQQKFAAAIPIAGRPCDDIDWKIPLYVIHSSADEVVPLGPTQKAVAQLKSRGADVQLIVIDRVTHFQTPLFAKPLLEAVPWVKDVWKDRPVK